MSVGGFGGLFCILLCSVWFCGHYWLLWFVFVVLLLVGYVGVLLFVVLVFPLICVGLLNSVVVVVVFACVAGLVYCADLCSIWFGCCGYWWFVRLV